MTVDHVNIVVSDMDRSVRFYADVLGLSPGFQATLKGTWIETVTGLPGARARCVFMEPRNGGARLELLQYMAPNGRALPENRQTNTLGVRHVAFVVDDMEALLERLAAAGAAPVSPPVEVPFTVGTMGRKRLCYFHDPDGALLEAAAYTK